MSTNLEERLRQGFKTLNRLMLFMWRLGFGQWLHHPKLGGCIMVITHTGRKSGRRRRTPVNYARVGNDVYCTAGFGAGSDWVRNILVHPNVEVWLPDGWWAGVADDVTGWPASRRLPLLRQVLINSGFAARMAGIDPKQMSDAELAAITEPYRLVRIERTVARTGPGGPGDLAWVWQVTTAGLGVMLLWQWLRPRR